MGDKEPAEKDVLICEDPEVGGFLLVIPALGTCHRLELGESVRRREDFRELARFNPEERG